MYYDNICLIIIIFLNTISLKCVNGTLIVFMLNIPVI